MKKTLIAFAALSAIAGMAQAQSTVTLYGLLDANVGATKTNVLANGVYGSQRNTIVGSGGLNGSRFGFRITEDLGGGLAAIGNLEGGVNLDTGASGQGALFGRQANVGLASASLGTLTIGRNKTPYYDLHGSVGLRETAFDATSNTNFGTVGNYNPAAIAAAGTTAATSGAQNSAYLLSNHGAAAGSTPNAATWLGFNARLNNSIRYTSPSFSGFSVAGVYGFGEDKTTNQRASQTYGGTAQYANGPIMAYLGFQSDGYARAAGVARQSLENVLVGASYDFGVAKVGANYNRAKLKNVTASGFLNGNGFVNGVAGGSIDPQKEYGFSVSVPFGATVVEANYGQSKGDTLGKSTGYGIQALYSLSKRTTLYTGFSSVKAYDRLAQLTVNALPGSSIERNQFFAVGARHTF